jgi:hypothetical protein
VKNPLAAHPPWRQLLIVSIVLPLLIVLAVLAFAWPAARMQPRNVPVGLVGSSPASERVLEQLSAADPGAFAFRLYADTSAARAAVVDRKVYGAFVVTARSVPVSTPPTRRAGCRWSTWCRCRTTTREVWYSPRHCCR